MNEKTDEKLKRAAELYAKREGESLLREIEMIRLKKVSYYTPRADSMVRKLASPKQKPKGRNMIWGICTAAACIVIAVRIVAFSPDMPPAPSESSAPPAASVPDTSAAPALPGMPAEILPVYFNLPADYRIIDSDFDNGISIYEFESEDHGNVVLTMYYAEDADNTFGNYIDEGFDEVIIDGTPVPAKVRDTYMLIEFEKDDLYYTLSSEDNLGALAAFYRNII